MGVENLIPTSAETRLGKDEVLMKIAKIIKIAGEQTTEDMYASEAEETAGNTEK